MSEDIHILAAEIQDKSLSVKQKRELWIKELLNIDTKGKKQSDEQKIKKFSKSRDFCYGNFRVAPNCILRSSLFSIVARGHRKIFNNVKMESLNGITIKYTGEQLDQCDLDVWIECINLSIYKENIEIEINRHNFLERIERTDKNNNAGNAQYKWLTETLNRLSEASISVKHGDILYKGKLIDSVKQDEKSQLIKVCFNLKMDPLFGKNTWSKININERNKLKNKPLAKWLHAFYHTHNIRKTYPYNIETIMKLCGSNTKDIYGFQQILKKSILEVEKVSDWGIRIKDKKQLEVVKRIDIKKNTV